MTSGGDPAGGQPRLAEIRRALDSADPRKRAAAAARAGTEPGGEEILLLALEDQAPAVRLAAVRALASIPGARFTREMMRVASTDESPDVRAEAVDAVGRALAEAARRAENGAGTG